MTGPADDDPVPRDAWLREALRHAPDADAAPPPRVDHAVLRMGRAAVAPPRAVSTSRAAPAASIGPGWAERLGAAWDWLARPAVAGAFASLMVATVVGVMWWDRPLEDALPPREAAAPAADSPAAASAEAPTRVAAAPEQAKATEPAAPVAAAPRAPPPAPAPARTDAAARKAAAPAAVAEPAPGAAAKTAPAGAAAPGPAEASADAGVRLRGAAERRELAAAAPAAVAPPAAPAAPSAAPLADLARATGALGALTARAAASTAISTPGLSNLRFEIRPRPQAWRWQRDDGELREVDDALQGWIAQADRTSRPHWQAGAAASEGTVATLRFSRDGTLRAVLRIGPKGLRLDRSGKIESAALPAGQAAALLGALDALGP